jgi:hypothetical protein
LCGELGLLDRHVERDEQRPSSTTWPATSRTSRTVPEISFCRTTERSARTVRSRWSCRRARGRWPRRTSRPRSARSAPDWLLLGVQVRALPCSKAGAGGDHRREQQRGTQSAARRVIVRCEEVRGVAGWAWGAARWGGWAAWRVPRAYLVDRSS